MDLKNIKIKWWGISNMWLVHKWIVLTRLHKVKKTQLHPVLYVKVYLVIFKLWVSKINVWEWRVDQSNQC